ncbi:MAG: hypothetical protein Q9196_007045 [Gyalolechia fulgens]
MPLTFRSFLPFLHPCHLPSSLRQPLNPVLPASVSLVSFRPASHAAQGRANKAAPGPGKRLGAKKSSQQYVVPGNIIFRQRGTHWFPGENCGMGRDHTIFAKEKGYVVFYRDPEQLSLGVGGEGYGGGAGAQVVGKKKVREKRRYIGVVLERGETLPRGRGVPRRRRLGLEAREMSTLATDVATTATTTDNNSTSTVSDQAPAINEVGGAVMRDQTKEARSRVPQERKLTDIRPGYMFREANWQIGKAEEKGRKGVRVYQKGDRFLAWRKKTKRLKAAAKQRALRGTGKKRAGGR